MAARKTAVAKKAKPDITPEAPVMLLTLTEAQAAVVRKGMNEAATLSKAAQEAGAKVEELLTMVRPEGANAFDPKTMTFYSVPQEAPKE